MKESKISNIILDYCEGIEHLEFSKSDLPEMVEKILNELKDNEEEIRRLKEENAELKDQIEFDYIDYIG